MATFFSGREWRDRGREVLAIVLGQLEVMSHFFSHDLSFAVISDKRVQLLHRSVTCCIFEQEAKNIVCVAATGTSLYIRFPGHHVLKRILKCCNTHSRTTQCVQTGCMWHQKHGNYYKWPTSHRKNKIRAWLGTNRLWGSPLIAVWGSDPFLRWILHVYVWESTDTSGSTAFGAFLAFNPFKNCLHSRCRCRILI